MMQKIETKKKQIGAPVLENRPMAPGIYRLRVEAPEIARIARPGQFVMVRIGQTLDPLLRRPFSIHAVYGSRTLDILFRVVGKGTGILSAIKRGETLDILGPLGSGFTWQVGSQPLLVAGGMGIAPLFFLAQFITSKGAGSQTTVLMGARNEAEILCVDELRSMGLHVHIATEDGSTGKKGMVTDLMTRRIMASKPVLYVCGPYPMFHAVADLAMQYAISGQVSLENFMACGTGVCLGCVAEMKDGRLSRVCQEGPVFEVSEVAWK